MIVENTPLSANLAYRSARVIFNRVELFILRFVARRAGNPALFVIKSIETVFDIEFGQQAIVKIISLRAVSGMNLLRLWRRGS